MGSIAILDFYYNIEDKWFDFLDFLESKRIPIYKIVDPMEKVGIPSLPIFAALVLILIYLLLGGGIAIGGAPSHTFSIQIADNVTGQGRVANVTILKNGVQVVSGITDSAGLLQVTLQEGNYSVIVEASGCTSIFNYNLPVFSGMQTFTIRIRCGAVGLTGKLCFSPEGVGSIDVIVKQNGDYTNTISDCGIDDCDFTPQPGYQYSFKSSTDYASIIDNYTTDQIRSLVASGTCVLMQQEVITPTEKGDVTVTVKDSQNRSLAGVKVELVNPSNENGVIDSDFTGYSGEYIGRAFFTEPVNTTFKVKVYGGNNTITQLSDKNYTVVKEGVEIEIVLNLAATTNFKVQESTATGFVGLSGATITIFDKVNRKINDGVTNQNGEKSFGVVRGEEYRAGFWKSGYNYTEKTFKGGDNVTVTMTAIEDKFTGAIDTRVVFADTNGIPVKNAILTLKKSDETPVGVPASGPTDSRGRASFEFVPPGDYCITVSREVGTESSCSTVKVEANKRTLKNIELSRVTYTLDVSVSLSGNDVENADVSIFDREKLVSSQKTPFTGEVFFDIPEQTDLTVRVTYVDNRGQSYVHEKYLGIITDEIEPQTFNLIPLDTDVSFQRIEENTSVISAGDFYHFTFTIGLPDYQGKKWDSVDLELNDPKGFVEFYKPLTLSDYITVTGERTNSTKFTIIGDYGDAKNLELTIPIRARNVLVNDTQHMFNFRGVWKSGSSTIKDPPSGFKQTPIFNITTKSYRLVKGFGIATYFLQGSIVVQPYNMPPIDITQHYIGGVEITNENQDTFSGKLVLEDSVFESSSLTNNISLTLFKTDGSSSELQRGLDFVVEDLGHRIKINDKSTIQLEHGDTLRIILEAVAVKPPRVQWVLTKDSDELDRSLKANVNGNLSVDIIVDEPTNLYDLSTKLKFHIQDKTPDKNIVEPYKYQDFGKITGSGISCEITNFWPSSPYTQVSEIPGGYIEVNFDPSCRIIPGGQIKIEITGGEDLKPAFLTLDTDSCIERPLIEQISVPPSVNARDLCVIGFKSNPSLPAGASYEKSNAQQCHSVDFDPNNNPISKFNVNLPVKSDCPAKLFDAIAKDDVQVCVGSKCNPGSSPGPNDYISTGTREVNYAYLGAIGNVVDPTRVLKINLTYINNQRNSLKSTYTFDIGAYIERLQFLNTAGNFFSPLKIQNYNDRLNCRDNYCNLDQLFLWASTETNNFAPPQGVTTIKLNRIKLIDVGPITRQDVQAIWQSALGSGITVVPQTPGQVTGNTGNVMYLINPALPLPVSQLNDITFEVGTTPENQGHQAYVYLKEFDDANTIDGNYLKIKNSVDGIQLLMLRAGKNYDATLNAKLNTRITIDSSVPSTSQGSVLNNVESLLRSQWGNPTNIGNPTSSNYEIIAAICDPQSSTFTNQINTPGTICNMANFQTGDISELSEVVLRHMVQNKVYFIGRNLGNLTDVIKRFNDSVVAIRNNLPSQKLQIVEREDTSTSPSTIYRYFTLPPKELYYYCVDKNNNECYKDPSNLPQELQTQLKKLGSQLFGFAESEITLKSKSFSDRSSAHIFITVDCNKKDPCSKLKGDFQSGPWGDPRFEIPSNGIFWASTGSSLPIYHLYADTVPHAELLLRSFLESSTLSDVDDSSLKYTRSGPVSYGYKELSIKDFNEFLANRVIKIRQQTESATAGVVSITTATPVCSIVLNDIGGGLVTANPIYLGNTYLYVVKFYGTEGGVEVPIYKLAGNDQYTTYGTPKCYASVQPYPETSYQASVFYSGPQCGRSFYVCGTGGAASYVGPVCQANFPAGKYDVQSHWDGLKFVATCFAKLYVNTGDSCISYSNSEECHSMDLAGNIDYPDDPGHGTGCKGTTVVDQTGVTRCGPTDRPVYSDYRVLCPSGRTFDAQYNACL